MVTDMSVVEASMVLARFHSVSLSISCNPIVEQYTVSGDQRRSSSRASTVVRALPEELTLPISIYSRRYIFAHDGIVVLRVFSMN